MAQASLLYRPLLVASRVIIGALSKRQQLRIKRLFMARPDIDLVGPIADAVELLMAVREINADAVILPLSKDGGEPGLCSHLLAEFPGLLVLAISANAQHVFLFDQAISKTQILDQGRAIMNLIGLEKAAN